MAKQRAEILKQFGASLRTCRMQAGVSQERLAALAGLDRSYVGGVERGDRNVSVVNIVRLAGALGIPPAALLDGVGDGDRPQAP